MSLVSRYTALLQRGRFVVLALWVIFGGAMAFFIMAFIGATSQQFDPPSGTQAYDADAVLSARFPNQARQTNFIVFVHLNDRNITTLPTLPLFFDSVTSMVNATLRPAYPASNAIPLNYFDLLLVSLTDVAEQMIAPSGQAMVLPITTQYIFTSEEAQDFGVALQSHVNAMAGATLLNATLLAPSGIPSNAIQYGFNGLPLFVHNVVATVKTDMALMDAIVLPIAFLVLAVTVRSVRLLLLPIASMGLALSTSFGLMYFVASNVVVSSTAPSLMMSLCIAMSIDYNLFIIARYTEELKRGARGAEVIGAVLSAAGHTILVSGTTLMISCLGMLFFPLNILRSFGMGCALAIALAMFSSLSFSPALLLAFPAFFEASANPTRWPSWLRTNKKASSAPTSPPPRSYPAAEQNYHTVTSAESESHLHGVESALAMSGANVDIVAPHGNADASGAENMEASVFYSLRFILRMPTNFIVTVVLIALVAALAVPIRDFKISDAFEVYIARGSSFRTQWEMFLSDFGYGYTSPYRFVFELDVDSPSYVPGTLVNTSGPFWLAAQQVLFEIVTSPDYSASLRQFSGPLLVGGSWVPYTTAMACLQLDVSGGCTNPNIAEAVLGGVSADRRAVLVDFTSSFSPTGNEGDAIYKSMLRYVDADHVQNVVAALKSPPMKAYVTGLGPRAMDSIDRIYALFPIIVGVTVGVMFIVVAFAFRTPIVPLRAVLSVASTELVSFGLVKLVYQSPGVLDWLGWPAVQSTGAVTWIVPIVAFTVIAGVALDYDVFLLTRVEEFLFVEENPPTVAVLKALCSTGRIITAAGVIMAIAFFGLLLSSTQALNVLGFYLVVAVLFDTFVVRTLMVPAVMSLLGAANWWPRRAQYTMGASATAPTSVLLGVGGGGKAACALDLGTVDSARVESSTVYPYLGPAGRREPYRAVSRKIERAPSIASQEDRASLVEAGTPNQPGVGSHYDYGAV